MSSSYSIVFWLSLYALFQILCKTKKNKTKKNKTKKNKTKKNKTTLS